MSNLRREKCEVRNMEDVMGRRGEQLMSWETNRGCTGDSMRAIDKL